MVGYFVLGPSDLYKVVKSVGQGISNLRQLSSDVTKTFENNMESQLQLEELRKAQRELNDAFSFRRSINVNPDTEFNTVNNTNTTAESSTTTTTTTTEPTTSTSTTPTKRKKRKRVKKQQVESPTTSVPENLEMPTLDDDTLEEERERQLLREQLETSLDDTLIREEEEREQLRRTRLERLEKAGTSSMPQQQSSSSSSLLLTDEQERFAQQLSGNWNEYILQNEEKLSPLSKIMERLAILEEEKKAADLRLEEEFRLRANVEERYYQQKRAILEEAATELQAEAYVSMTPTTTTEEETKRTV